jgi:hypothetical protein
MIEKCEFGLMVVDGKEYRADLVILPRSIKSNWWRRQGHELALADLDDVIQEDIEALVVGTGFSGLMRVSEEVTGAARARGLDIQIRKTPEAVRIFNNILPEKKAAGAFHLTC